MYSVKLFALIHGEEISRILSWQVVPVSRKRRVKAVLQSDAAGPESAVVGLLLLVH